ncbi:hypothetical protein AYO21_10073 [Fonsecaea monophora]|uniref:Uncharacterized protein n=1 Tax=Fonsecaea monophora TaxID=254056 RepID=A0A177EVW6_9EURO|nr:hypothetical protein AYO21_10073 [Fonsecaea monophora]OAG35756.1 hypothetical protein AYO21_10073 [Fonsecaea monophora]
MSTGLLRLATLLLALLMGIFTFAWLVAGLSAGVGAALERLSADQPAQYIGPPARLVFQSLLAAETLLFGEKWTLGAFLLIQVAIVHNRRVATIFHPVTREITRRWTSAAWQRRLKDGPTTAARNIVKDGFPAAAAWPTVAKILTDVVSTLQFASAWSSANVLCFDILIQSPRDTPQRLEFSFGGLTFRCFALSGATSFTTLVTATVQSSLAQSRALGWFLLRFMADDVKRITTAPTWFGDFERAGTAYSRVTNLLAFVTT